MKKKRLSSLIVIFNHKLKMTTFIATFVIFSLAMLGLSVGMIFSDVKIKGHCGGQTAPQTQCIKDKDGRIIETCDHCDCE